MLKILCIILNDIALMLKDRTSYIILLLMPAILILVLGNTFNFSSDDININLAIYNEDAKSDILENISLGEELENIFTLPNVSNIIDVYYVNSIP